MQLFFHPDILPDSVSAVFDKEESTHIVKVLRRKEGDRLHIANGRGWLFEGEISVATPKRCEVRIINQTEQAKHPYYLHIAVAPTKMNERYEWFLEKAVELGVDEITPVICKHSERTSIKIDRFEKIILSAMKQSLRYHLPKINPATDILQFFKNDNLSHSSNYVAHCQEDEKILLSERLLSATNRVTILIGPEGDFSTEEITIALQKNFLPVSLGEYRLRTETAAIAACHTVGLIHEIVSAKNQPL